MVEDILKNNKYSIPLAILVAGILVAGAIFYNSQNFQSQKSSETKNLNVMSAQEAAQKAIDYINKNLLSGGMTASLVNVAEENGLYKFRLKIENQEYNSYVTKNGRLLFVQEAIDLEKKMEKVVNKGTTIGNFSISEDEICKEDGKPIVYFFGSEGCPHCRWEHPIIEEVAKKFEGYISFHNNMNDSEKDSEVFSKYSTGGIPTLVLGCKYYRVGSGETAGKEAETKNLTAIFCKLTNNQPENICSSVKDLVEQING